ncbi:hydroxysqualene dehydroxylase HpnE [Nocardia higoensis]|uniref:hydroxysqualene dehydroxylase HpnE n=1 Tax=Nocardia higoensis TaxID=228599 RepID=UPI0002ECF1FB|nr:hydroxysqualene dehydroxylase HpnE [Nocardia higoensis]
MSDRSRPRVAGAGLAGLTAAVRLADQGYALTLIEKRGRLGGRTISFDVAGLDEPVDNGPHLFAGCYDALLRYVETIGTRDRLLWDGPPFAIRTDADTLLTTSAPSFVPLILRRLHDAGFLARLPIPWRDRPAALRGLVIMLAAAVRLPAELDDRTVDAWFREIGMPQSLRALSLDQFVIGLLNEKPERVSALTFAKTLRFVGARALRGNVRAGDAVWPKVSLHALFVEPAVRYLTARGAHIRTGTGVVDIDLDGDRLSGLRLAGGETLAVDAAVLALPPWALTGLIDNGRLGAYEHFTPVRKIEAAPISSVYVWLDRPLRLRRPAENLRDTTIEWVFDTSGMRGGAGAAGHCYALAVSASWDVVHHKNADFTELALESLRKHYPREMAEATVLRTHVIHQPRATFSAQPGFESLRLPARTPIEGLFLAGDWTRTELPSTMEAAADSGERAADEVSGYLTR